MKYLSLFSGIGAFEVAVKQLKSDWQSIGYSEIDKYALQVYQKHFPNHKNFGDITKINIKNLPDFDLLVGGIPCQSWSIAGKRRGFKDERGSMWFNFINILKIKKPKYFLIENVLGLLSHNNGKSFEFLCEKLCEAKYKIDFNIINANLVSAQQRKRIFIFGKIKS